MQEWQGQCVYDIGEFGGELGEFQDIVATNSTNWSDQARMLQDQTLLLLPFLARFNQRKKGPHKITTILICQMVDGSVCDDGLKQGYGNDNSQNKTDKTAITEFLIFIETIAICFFFLK